MRKIAKWAAATAVLASARPLGAHHSISMIDIATPVWVKGVVAEYKPINPHAMIQLEVRGADGQVQRWTLEGPNPGRLARYHLPTDFLKPGDVIEACGFVPKRHPEESFPPPHFIHSPLLLMPNGQMQLWGPYGKLDNCVRPNDSKQLWLNFVSNPMVRDLWCSKYVAAVPLSPYASKALVDDINRDMNRSCDICQREASALRYSG